MSKKTGKFIANIAKDIINENIHGYGTKNIYQKNVDDKIKDFNESSVYTEEERLAMKNVSEKIFKKHLKTFSSLDDMFHPAHYGGDETYEVIKIIEAWNLNFHLGNVVKYIFRAGIKNSNKEIKDLKKAAWYLNRYIELKEKKSET